MPAAHSSLAKLGASFCSTLAPNALITVLAWLKIVGSEHCCRIDANLSSDRDTPHPPMAVVRTCWAFSKISLWSGKKSGSAFYYLEKFRAIYDGNYSSRKFTEFQNTVNLHVVLTKSSLFIRIVCPLFIVGNRTEVACDAAGTLLCIGRSLFWRHEGWFAFTSNTISHNSASIVIARAVSTWLTSRPHSFTTS